MSKLKPFSAYILALCLCACQVSYSFTGADIPAEADTFSVDYFTIEASLADPAYAQQITEDLKDRLLSQTKLNYSKSNGDIQYKGTVTRYDVQPIAIQGNETAARNRFTISLRIEYFNKFDESKNFEKTISEFTDFDSTEDFKSVEQNLIEIVNELLTQDIFNASLGNW